MPPTHPQVQRPILDQKDNPFSAASIRSPGGSKAEILLLTLVLVVYLEAVPILSTIDAFVDAVLETSRGYVHEQLWRPPDSYNKGADHYFVVRVLEEAVVTGREAQHAKVRQT